MLRLLVLILLLVNGIYFAWSHELLRGYGFGPEVTTEPQRLGLQIQPEAVRILSNAEAAQIQSQIQAESQGQGQGQGLTLAEPPAPQAAAAQAAAKCLRAGPFNEAQATALWKTLEANLAKGTWALEAINLPERWLVYMGPYANAEGLAKKRKELANLNIQFQPIKNAALEPGLTLGAFATPEQAETELRRLGSLGVRTARVLREYPQAGAFELRLPVATDTLKTQVLRIAPLLTESSLSACA
jgi:hypothetical protein